MLGSLQEKMDAEAHAIEEAHELQRQKLAELAAVDMKLDAKRHAMQQDMERRRVRLKSPCAPIVGQRVCQIINHGRAESVQRDRRGTCTLTPGVWSVLGRLRL